MRHRIRVKCLNKYRPPSLNPVKSPAVYANSAFLPLTGRQMSSKVKSLAPQVGFEPTTLRLTAEWLVAASRGKQKACRFIMPVFAEIGGTQGDSPEIFHERPPTYFLPVSDLVATCGTHAHFPDRRISRA
jgi:hypothetical protein